MKIFKSENSVFLGDVTNSRNNNLDILRFIAALLVIFSHSFPISYGEKYSDYLSVFTDEKLSFGGLAVSVFFVSGGFLIAKSVLRVKDAKQFFKARCFRIFPPLIFVILILSFVIGPILTSLSLPEYFQNTGTYRYLLNGILVLQHNLPGVFENNIFGPTVNGPLWTLPIEFLCYIFCFIVYKMGFLDKKKFKFSIPLFVLGCLGVCYVATYVPFLNSVIRPVILFYIGMGMYVYRDKIKLNTKIAILFALLMATCFIFKIVNTAVIILFPYILFSLAYGTRIKFQNFSKYGEFSYGIYLWGWPIQQIICEANGGSMNHVLNTIITIPFAIIMGIITYYLIEKSVHNYLKRG